ncbi:MAG: helix-turn-helix domain-containing protein [Burkholderiales bacterium]|nr:helix-turn-helix domain-containing protein [Burkholderiales bacterium]
MNAHSIRVILACKKLSLFGGISDESLEAFGKTSFVQTVPAGTEIVAQDEQVEYLYGIASGAVEALATHNGFQTLLYVVPAGRCFAYSCTLIQTPSFASFVTVERSELVMIPVAVLREQLQHDGGLALAFARELARATDMAAREILNQKLRPASERLASLLLREHAKAPGSNVIDFSLSKRKVALRLGATPETLSRILASLKAVGVETDGNRYIIHDIDALRTFAKPSMTLDPPAW